MSPRLILPAVVSRQLSRDIGSDAVSHDAGRLAGMSVLSMSGAVRRAFGARSADALSAGVGLPPWAECWGCAQQIDIAGARPGGVVLSVVQVATACVTVFCHRGCGTSTVFTPEQFETVWNATLAARPDEVATPTAAGGALGGLLPSRAPEGHMALLVDGQQVI